MKKLLIAFGFILLVSGCRKAKDINLVLPAYEGQLMVECYLEPGKNYRLLMTESVSYLENVAARPVNNALVTIRYKDRLDTLYFNNSFIKVNDTIKYYNYVSKIKIPKDYFNTFELYIRDSKGREAFAQTTIARPPVIDSGKVLLENEIRTALVYLKDDQKTPKYYRFLVYQNNTKSFQTQSTIATNREEDFDRYLFFQGGQLIFKSKNDFFVSRGVLIDSVAVKTLEINKDYYEFIESVRNAQNANGNPFAQPASIRSNIQGGMGIFTGFDPVVTQMAVPR